MKPKRDYNKSVYRSLALVMQMGFDMLVPICLMTAFGIFLDRKLGTSFLVILLFFAGALAGAQNVYRLARKIMETDEDHEKKEREKKDEDK